MSPPPSPPAAAADNSPPQMRSSAEHKRLADSCIPPPPQISFTPKHKGLADSCIPPLPQMWFPPEHKRPTDSCIPPLPQMRFPPEHKRLADSCIPPPPQMSFTPEHKGLADSCIPQPPQMSFTPKHKGLADSLNQAGSSNTSRRSYKMKPIFHNIDRLRQFFKEEKETEHEIACSIHQRVKGLPPPKDLATALAESEELITNYVKTARVQNRIMYLIQEVQTQLNELDEKHEEEQKSLMSMYESTKRSDDQLEANFFEKKRRLHAKYNELREQLHTRIHEIVNGDVDIEANSKMKLSPEDKSNEGVPDFWLNVMKANPVLAKEIKEHDESALKSLADIKCTVDQDESFKLEFFFKKNSFFKNEVLTKSYFMFSEDPPGCIKGSEIEWHEGKSLNQIYSGNGVVDLRDSKRRRENSESFFVYFDTYHVSDIAAAGCLSSTITRDYEIGCTIRDIIPRVIKLFLEIDYRIPWQADPESEEGYLSE